jgi:hypothetical protein
VTGLALQATALAWLAAITSPDVPYIDLVPPFAMAGVGMALFFAPVATVVLGAVRPQEAGKASGANNAIRELGGVFGVAVLASIFAHQGGYGSADMFTDGIIPALWVGASVVGVGALAAGLIPGRAAETSASATRRFRARTSAAPQPRLPPLRGPARRPLDRRDVGTAVQGALDRSSAGHGRPPVGARTAVVTLAVDHEVLHHPLVERPPRPSGAEHRAVAGDARADRPFDQRPLIPALCVVQRGPDALASPRGRDRRPGA